jgi:glutathione S-transferase
MPERPSMQALPALVTCLAFVMYFWLIGNVILARGKYGIQTPSVIGNKDFERVYRAQQNTLEHLVVFVPLLFLFSQYVSPTWGAGIGLVWVLARVWYALGYYAPTGKKRSAGFTLSVVALLLLLLGTLIGIIRVLL